ncbi:MAG: 2-succinyl-5-enolpyruvyl-6-hydroxy-3-cyclohexene-1-carboxylic-acid synthase [bacterium]|nr:2-succinyl-5-enolpyruvyl-6-hydroxy-3-cyclohexene-1-carboxylic-acid synthase [bacterium]MCY3651828.1 2-succinyl-5-enolpyruvyl-6-hydroxy-3-cyclohexene-1-carboxylic-acid synthase [bacterium]
MALAPRRQLENRVSRAAARAAVAGIPSIVTLAVPAEESDPLAVAMQAEPPFVYLELPDRGFAMAAFGEAGRILTPPTEERFGLASSALLDLADRTHSLAWDGADPEPLLIGGFSFSPVDTWPGFPSGRMVLPELAYIRRDTDRRVWVAAAEVKGDSDPTEVAARLIEIIGPSGPLKKGPETLHSGPTGPSRPYELDLFDPDYLAAAKEAVRVIRDGALQKVAFARRVDLDYRPSLGPFLATLRNLYGRCAIFAFGRADGRVFCGASPELLARVTGVRMETVALAGTAPRGRTDSEEQQLADRLINDEKELQEHGLVRSELRKQLAKDGFVLDPPEPTGVLRLPGILHLATPISAVAPVGTNVLDVVGSLHPTPAVGGLPGKKALAWIADHEPFDRGWYAGPIGYCDLSGNGEFHVALRSCLMEDNRIGLFAGAGIVSASSPVQELAETNLKLKALLRAFYDDGDHRRRTYATADALVSALQAGGVAGVVISPGSRSTPLVLAVHEDGPPSYIVLDERSAGFLALGMARSTGLPVALVCTSGSAAANYLPALVEADRARIPLVVLTADRPPGSLDRDTPQTIDQIGLYGSRTRAAVNFDTRECDPMQVADQALQAIGATYPPHAGPVHLNVPFAKPLEPPSRRDPLPSFNLTLPAESEVPIQTGSVEALQDLFEQAERGLIVAGPQETGPAARESLIRISRESGWPLLADGLSMLRQTPFENLITTGDMLASDPVFVGGYSPDAVLRLGGTPTGTASQDWLAGLQAAEMVLDPDSRWTAPGRQIVLRDPIAPLLGRISPSPAKPCWTDSWKSAERRLRERRRSERGNHPHSELAVTGMILDHEPMVWVGSSLPVRHVNAMMEPGCGATVWGNRGACGIDGAIATAAGCALGIGQRLVALMGDLSFLHDVGSLNAARSLKVDLTVVVLDNGGGAIFDSLPYLKSLHQPTDTEDFQRIRDLFYTPHNQDLAAIARGFGVRGDRIDPHDLRDGLKQARAQPGVSVLIVKSNPRETFAAYDRLYGR